MTLVISVILGIEDGAFMGGPTAFKSAVIPQEASSILLDLRTGRSGLLCREAVGIITHSSVGSYRSFHT